MTEQFISERAAISKSDALGLICHLFPWISRFRNGTLQDYARSVFDIEPHRCGCDVREHAMVLLQACVRRAARKAGFAEDRIHRIGEEIFKAPVMQTGPHLHLLIEPDAYYTHLFSLMGLRAHSRPVYISYAVSTVKFVERGRKGPGWLRLEGNSINVFGLTRSQMVPFSILARNGLYCFRLKNVDLPEFDGDASSRLRSLMPPEEFPSAAEAIRRANAVLWDRFFDPEIDFLQLDDEDIADLVVEHLQDSSSWLARRLIGDANFVHALLQYTEALCEGPWRGWLKNSTDLFWGCENGRLFPLRLAGSQLEARGREDFTLTFSAAHLIHALQARKVIPNLFLMFIVTAMLPGVRVLGGSRHTIYYPLMRYVLGSALRASGADPTLLATIAADVKPGVWGHRVLLANPEPFSELESLRGRGISVALEKYRNRSLEDSCGTLAACRT
jgi:hypothetical protein